MKKVDFHVCNKCGNIITSTNTAEISCCGKKLKALIPNVVKDKEHLPVIESVEDELLITINHDMTKKHFIAFVAYLTCDKLCLIRLYPEQDAIVRFREYGNGIVFAYCTEHGLRSIIKS